MDPVIGLADREIAVGAKALVTGGDSARNLQVARDSVQRQISGDLHGVHRLGDLGGLYRGALES